VGVLATGSVEVASLITRRLKFDDAIAGLRAAADPDQIKVVLEMLWIGPGRAGPLSTARCP
jgi:threonine dehydrogenase-like Zn-dependent dehydrogenase